MSIFSNITDSIGSFFGGDSTVVDSADGSKHTGDGFWNSDFISAGLSAAGTLMSGYYGSKYSEEQQMRDFANKKALLEEQLAAEKEMAAGKIKVAKLGIITDAAKHWSDTSLLAGKGEQESYNALTTAGQRALLR